MTKTASFDELTSTQRLTIFLFSLITQPIEFFRKEVVVEGVFEYLHAQLEASIFSQVIEEVETLPLICDVEHKDLTILAVLCGDGSIAPILPHESECSPLILSPGAYIPENKADMNPYNILGIERYGEDLGEGPRRIVILGCVAPEKAEVYNTEPMLTILDFDFSGEDPPNFFEFPLDLGRALLSMLPRTLKT